jgi:hypothetical protein
VIDAYIFNQGYSHYMNIWPKESGHHNVIWAVDYKPATTAIFPETRKSSPSLPSIPQSIDIPLYPIQELPGGVVQVYEGEGTWDMNETEDLKIFAPIKAAIDALITRGYEHIGFTYSANQRQTAEMFNTYKFGNNDKALPSTFTNSIIKPNKFNELRGTGQGRIMGNMKGI